MIGGEGGAAPAAGEAGGRQEGGGGEERPAGERAIHARAGYPRHTLHAAWATPGAWRMRT